MSEPVPSPAMPAPPHREAVRGLFVAHHGWLLGRLQRKLRQLAQAEDLASEAFCQLLGSRVELSLLREPRAYLTRVAQNLLFQHYRAQELEQAYLRSLAAWPEALAPSPEERLEVMQAVLQLDRALGSLPVAARAAFLMNQLDGLGYAEIAQRLGLSERTVTRHMAQALRQVALAELAFD